jgi:hypothetical protein
MPLSTAFATVLTLAAAGEAPADLVPSPPPVSLSVTPEGHPRPAGCPEAVGDSILPSAVVEAVPDVALVHVWTIEYAGLDGGGTRALLTAARARGALPRVRLRAGYDDDDRIDRDAFDRVEDHREVSQYSLDLQLEWDFAELVSGIDTYRAVREGRAQLELRHALVSQATTVYFDRLRLAVDEALRCDDRPAVARERRLRLRELDATLDGLTGGRWRSAFDDVPLPDSGPETSLRGRAPEPPDSESP